MDRLTTTALRTALLLIAASVAGSRVPLGAQDAAPNRDPNAARLVTTDIPLFWRVFDKASPATAGDLFQREYLDAGSPGLRDFARLRIQSGEQLADAVAARRRYYAAIRADTLSLDADATLKASIRASFRRLQAIYPGAIFPDVYFVIGRMNAGGTTSPAGLLISVEMNARDVNTPVDELDAWRRATAGEFRNLTRIVAHELIHVQQRLPRDSTQTLLGHAVAEGAADFVGALISDGHINAAAHEYGRAHERELWDAFRRDMNGRDTSGWLAQGSQSLDRPADLGYFIGYRICAAFYARVANKADATRQILESTDAGALLQASGYSGER